MACAAPELLKSFITYFMFAVALHELFWGGGSSLSLVGSSHDVLGQLFEVSFLRQPLEAE